MQNVMILGATSAIAQEVAKLFAVDGASLFLVGRNDTKLQAIADDLHVRGAKQVATYTLDLTHLDRHEAVLQQAIEALGRIDIVLIAHGTLSNQHICQQSVAETIQELTTNFLSVVSLLTLLANYFEQQCRGCIAVITSVAGDRGRQSNYVYGTAKGAVSIFLQGLRHRLYKAGVVVMTIKPGFVSTPMTASQQQGWLFTSPAVVGKGIYRAILQKREVVYLPSYWRWIMCIIKAMPGWIFQRTNL